MKTKIGPKNMFEIIWTLIRPAYLENEATKNNQENVIVINRSKNILKLIITRFINGV